jgi:hypothetical protein
MSERNTGSRLVRSLLEISIAQSGEPRRNGFSGARSLVALAAVIWFAAGYLTTIFFSTGMVPDLTSNVTLPPVSVTVP